MVSVFLPQNGTNLTRRFAYVSEIDACTVERRADRDERDIGFQHGGAQIGGGPDPLADQALQHRLQTFFVDRRVARVDARDFGGVNINAHAFVTDLGETDAGHQPDVSRADDRDAHQASSASRLWWYQFKARRRPSSTSIVGL